MEIFVFFSLTFAKPYEFPPFPDASGGVFGWNKLLGDIGGGLDGFQVAGYTVHSAIDLAKPIKDATSYLSKDKLDLSQLMTNIVGALPKEMNLSEIINGGSFSFTLGAIEMPKFSIDFGAFLKAFKVKLSENDKDFTSYLIGLGIGVAALGIILLLFFAMSLIFYLVISCALCCCCKPKDTKPPTVGSMIIFYVGAIIIFVVGLFAFLVIPTLNDIKEIILSFDQMVPALAIDVNQTVGRMSSTLQGFATPFYQWAKDALSPMDPAFDELSTAIKGYIANADKTISGSDSLFSMFEGDGVFNKTISMINGNISSLPDEAQPPTIDIYSKVITAKEKMESKMQNVEKQVDDQILNVKDKIHSLSSKIKNNEDFFNVDSHLKSIYSAMEKYSKPNALEQISPSFSSIYTTAKKYIDQYWICLIALIVLVALFFFSLILCYAFTFHNKCCCCRCCCTDIPHCFPFCQILFIFIFGLVSIAVPFVFIYINQNFSTLIDTSITEFIDFIPQRKISVPDITLNLQSNTKDFPLTIKSVVMSFSNSSNIVSEILSSPQTSGLNSILDISSFLELEHFQENFKQMPNTVQSALKEVVSQMVGSEVEKASAFIADINDIHELEGIPDWSDTINKSLSQLNEFIEQAKYLNNTEANQTAYNLKDLMTDLNQSLEVDLSAKFSETKNTIMRELVNKLNSDGFPTVYATHLARSIDPFITTVFHNISNLIGIIPNVLNGFQVKTIQGPIAVVFKLFLYDLSAISLYASISLHLSFIGYFLVVLAMTFNRQNMLPPSEHNEGSEEGSLSSDVENKKTPRKTLKKTKSIIHDTESDSYSSSSSSSYSKKSHNKHLRLSKTKSRRSRTVEHSDSYSSNSSNTPPPRPPPTSRKSHRSSRQTAQPTNSNASKEFWLNY